MIVSLFAMGVLIFAGLSSKTPEVSNKNTSYCVSKSKHRSVKTETQVEGSQNCTTGTMRVSPSEKMSLSERKAK